MCSTPVKLSATAVCLALFAMRAQATIDQVQVTLEDGRPFVTLNIYGNGEPYDLFGLKGNAMWSLPSEELQSILQGSGYVAELLEKAVNHPASIMLVAQDDGETFGNAFASSDVAPTGDTWFIAQILHGIAPATPTGDSAVILVYPRSEEDGAWYRAQDAMHVLPKNGNSMNLAATFSHEMLHALGILTRAETADDAFALEGDYFRFLESRFTSTLNRFEQGLRDSDGTAAAPGMAITVNGGTDQAGAGTFDVDLLSPGIYFTGEHVEEVLNGALIYPADSDGTGEPLPGLPVNGWEYVYTAENVDYYTPEMSHIELQNSLMSHQSWRNWGVYMEAELALLQDLGLEIDRRKWFGYSVYNSGATIVNTHPFYERNQAGTAYLQGVASSNPWGIGLHVYGRDNDVTQAADILTRGEFAIGIRLEGSNNTLRIAPGVTIQSDGSEGFGLAVTYGKNHNVVHQGVIAARGQEGIAALFSFGDNVISNDFEQRGSYIYRPSPMFDTGLEVEDIGLDGALVERFDVSGALIGTKAAILIDDNALVSNINILNGALLAGDIVSLWDPNDERIDAGGLPREELTTTLTFGQAAAADGAAIADVPDPNFYLRYDGNIYGTGLGESESEAGAAAIAVRVAGGELSYNGTANVLSVEVLPQATLSGNGTYNVTQWPAGEDEAPFGGTFVNNGTLSPGNSLGTMTINGAFEMGASGRLLMEFDADGRTDRLQLRSLVQDVTLTSANLTMQPAEGYYSGTLQIPLSGMVTAQEGTISFAGATVTTSGVSPTLSMSGALTDATLAVTVERAPDAYSRWAFSDAARGVAAVFDRNAGHVQGQMQDLVARLDFLSPDGSALQSAFESLSPDLYGRAGAASLFARQTVARTVINELSAGRLAAARLGGKEAFVVPLGGYADRDADGVRSTYAGILAGVQTQRADAGGTLTLGAHTAVLTRKDKLSNAQGSQADSESFYLGAHGRYDFAGESAPYLFGLAQVSIENTDMDRYVLDDHAESDWTGWGASLAAGAGQTFDLTENLSAGPVFWLDYGLAHQPATTESSSHGTALSVASETYQSLSSSLGVRAHWRLPVQTMKASIGALAAWNHEFLSRYGTAQASFAGLRQESFRFESEVQARDTGLAAVSFKAEVKERFSAGAGLGCEFGSNTSGLWGHVNLRWAF